MPSHRKQLFIFSMKIAIYLISRIMMEKITIALFFSALSVLALPFPGHALSTKSPALLARGETDFSAAAGAVALPDETVLGFDLSLRIGLLPYLELAAPLGLSLRLLNAPGAGALYLSAGIADLYIVGTRALLYRPTAMLAAVFYMGSEATIRGAVDISGAEHGLTGKEHPAWLRGSVALIVEFGKIATLAAGIAYQRIVVEAEHPPKLDRTGWAYDARISFGSVQTQPFSELPMLSIHLQPDLDFITITRIDINTDTGNRTFRLLMGFEYRR
jgi:hypothetical protein